VKPISAPVRSSAEIETVIASLGRETAAASSSCRIRSFHPAHAHTNYIAASPKQRAVGL
jgi:hypothetical protein